MRTLNAIFLSQESRLAHTRGPRRRRLLNSLHVFLERLACGDTVLAAAKASGRKGTRALYRFRAEYPEFAELWDAAIDAGTDYLEQIATERARDGVVEDIYQGGKVVGTRTRYSDGLLLRLLAARNPKRWGVGPGGSSVTASMSANLSGVGTIRYEVELVEDFRLGE